MDISVSISSFVSFGICIYIQYFFDALRNQTLNKNYLLELIKKRSKVHGMNMSCELALHLTNQKHFLKTICQNEFGYGLFTKLPKLIVVCDFSPSSFQLKRGILTRLSK